MKDDASLGNLGAPITSRSNARVKALRASFSGSASQPGELFGIEGETLLAEAVRSGIKLDTVFVRQGSKRLLHHAGLTGLRAEQTCVLAPDVFESAVGTTSPQGIAATAMVPESNVGLSTGRSGIVLVVESLQDPGNLGTLLRSAEAFGATLVMMTPDTVNPWNAKVVRASAGSVFRVPVVRAPLAELRRRLNTLGLRLFAAVPPRPGAIALMEAFLAGPCAVMIGNEGAGLSPEALALADALLTIPCATESLNAAVAGSTILYESMRQRNALHRTEAKR